MYYVMGNVEDYSEDPIPLMIKVLLKSITGFILLSRKNAIDSSKGMDAKTIFCQTSEVLDCVRQECDVKLLLFFSLSSTA